MSNGLSVITGVSQPVPGSGVTPPGGAAGRAISYGFLVDTFPDIADMFYNPFKGDAIQTGRNKAYCQVIIGTGPTANVTSDPEGVSGIQVSPGTLPGVNVSDQTAPFLISVNIMDGGASEYNCEIELDDRDGRLPIPGFGTPVSVLLGWESEALLESFNGTVCDVEHGFGRKQGGRRMWIKAFGATMTNAIKTPMQFTMGKGSPPGEAEGPQISLEDFLSKIAENAGFQAIIHPTLGSITRDYWAQMNESLMHWVARHGEELGGLYRAQNGNQLIFTIPQASVAELITARRFDVQTGVPTTPPTSIGNIICKWGANLIGYKVRPEAAQPTWRGANQNYYAQDQSSWKSITKTFGINYAGQVDAMFRRPDPAPNAHIAQQQVDGAERNNSLFIKDGVIIINGEPRAHWLGTAEIQGVRPGVDALYRINTANHVWSRQGYVTRMNVGGANQGIIGGVTAAGLPILGVSEIQALR